MSNKLYELKKDVSMPGGYWRAGEKKTESEWRGEFHIKESTPFQWVEEWFIDLTPEENFHIDEVKEIVNEVFDRHQLRSITYKEAAIAACKQCLIRIKPTTNEQ